MNTNKNSTHYSLRYSLTCEQGRFNLDDRRSPDDGLADALIIVSILRGENGGVSVRPVSVPKLSRREFSMLLKLACDSLLQQNGADAICGPCAAERIKEIDPL